MTSQFCRNFTQYRRSGKVTTEHPNLLYFQCKSTTKRSVS
nr:MAG TPA: hypothetical protein [Caudoviricetes sp.]